MEHTSDPSLTMRRTKAFTARPKYLLETLFVEEPVGDSVPFVPLDDTGGFFEKGRDFESVGTAHKFTEQEKKQLARYESLDYLTQNNSVYRAWLHRSGRSSQWQKWLMMGIIGFTIGFVRFALSTCIAGLNSIKFEYVSDLSREVDNNFLSWIYLLGYSAILTAVSASLVAFIQPAAAGSGLPEVIGYLNGVSIGKIYNVVTLGVKFFSCVFAVGSGLPVGPEGPMIHMGSLIGAGLSQFRSKTLGFSIPMFKQFRNSRDRRDFISAGAAAGVSAAFAAPVGGMLFAMEEVASFWNQQLAWQILFCCMMSTATADLLRSAFLDYEFTNIGTFKRAASVIFSIDLIIPPHFFTLIPAAVIGVIGGLLGIVFTFFNLKANRFRRRFIVPRKWLRVLEPVIVVLIFVTLNFWISYAFPCTTLNCDIQPDDNSPKCVDERAFPEIFTEEEVQSFHCFKQNNTYNEAATLMLREGDSVIEHLFTRQTHKQFGYGSLIAMLALYFPFACYIAGSAISTGFVVPMLVIGGLYGRLVGLVIVDMFGIHPIGSFSAWIDPGIFALLGAAAFFSGVSRLTVSLTVIMVEITGTVALIIPLMTSIIVAKQVADFATHSLYHALIEMKCIPFLDSVLRSKNYALDLYTARDVMNAPAVTLPNGKVPVSTIARTLLHTPHGGFPVVDTKKGNVFVGLMLRSHLEEILLNQDLFLNEEDTESYTLPYEVLVDAERRERTNMEGILEKLSEGSTYDTVYIDIAPYANESALSVNEKFSLERAFIVFRTMGLRHLVVVDELNKVVGMITRKDLMGHVVDHKLSEAKEQGAQDIELKQV